MGVAVAVENADDRNCFIAIRHREKIEQARQLLGSSTSANYEDELFRVSKFESVLLLVDN